MEEIKKRDNIQIVLEILDLVKRGAPKTRIVYKANINFTLLRDKVKNLMIAGMVVPNGDRYQITEKGKVFLEKASELQCMMMEMKQ